MTGITFDLAPVARADSPSGERVSDGLLPLLTRGLTFGVRADPTLTLGSPVGLEVVLRPTLGVAAAAGAQADAGGGTRRGGASGASHSINGAGVDAAMKSSDRPDVVIAADTEPGSGAGGDSDRAPDRRGAHPSSPRPPDAIGDFSCSRPGPSGGQRSFRASGVEGVRALMRERATRHCSPPAGSSRSEVVAPLHPTPRHAHWRDGVFGIPTVPKDAEWWMLMGWREMTGVR